MTKFKPGDTVWLVLHRNADSRKGYAAKVAKVGRKWVTLDHGGFRFDAETGTVDGGRYSSPGRVYEDCAAHVAEKQLADRWRELTREVSHMYRPQPGVTLDDVAAARRLLRLAKP